LTSRFGRIVMTPLRSTYGWVIGTIAPLSAKASA
jgi:hypothetical protein